MGSVSSASIAFHSGNAKCLLIMRSPLFSGIEEQGSTWRSMATARRGLHVIVAGSRRVSIDFPHDALFARHTKHGWP
jgi:hypothetical protein